MIRHVLYVCSAIFLALLQSSLSQFIPLPGIIPDLLLIFVVLIARFHRGLLSLLSAFIGAMILDSVGLERLGYLMFIYLSVAFLVVSFRDKMYSYSILSFCVLFFIMALLKAVYVLVMFFFSMDLIYVGNIWALAIEIASSTVCAALLYPLYYAFMRHGELQT